MLNVLSKENMDSLLGDDGAFRDWPLKSWGLLSLGSDPFVLILRDIFKIVISQQKYTQANMSIQFTYYLWMQCPNCLDKALSKCMYVLLRISYLIRVHHYWFIGEFLYWNFLIGYKFISKFFPYIFYNISWKGNKWNDSVSLLTLILQ